MRGVAVKHSPHLLHHIEQARSWLNASAAGAHTTALSYAALELRFAVERLAIHYWVNLLGRKLNERDLKVVSSFKAVEREIYDLAGHQAEINGHFAFMRVFHTALEIKEPLNTPNIGQLSKFWHACSDLCHIRWVLGSRIEALQADGYRTLTEIVAGLDEQARSACNWPSIQHPPLRELRDRFVAGTATADDLHAYLEREGAWGVAEYPDGRKEFIGKAIPPLKGKGEN